MVASSVFANYPYFVEISLDYIEFENVLEWLNNNGVIRTDDVLLSPGLTGGKKKHYLIRFRMQDDYTAFMLMFGDKVRQI